MTKRLLLVSYAFPPFNSVGAVRLGKIAKYLTELGWDIRVVTASDQPFSQTLPLGIDADRVTYTPSVNVDWVARKAAGSKGHSYVESGARPPSNALKRVLKTLYTNVTYLPDSSIGWLPFAHSAGVEIMRRWKPDLIYASAPPFTSLLAARALAKSAGVPWAAELRDLWSSSPYYPWSRARRSIDRVIERRTLSSAAAFVGATGAISDELARVHGKPAVKILSGFEPPKPSADEPVTGRGSTHATDPGPAAGDGTLRIVYTGSIYRDKRDPKLLFEALRELPRGQVQIDFYGRNLEPLHSAIREHGLEESVKVHGAVSFSDALAKQAEADLLLLLLWLDPGDDGSIPAKVYEYLSAKRTILGIGLNSSEASKLIATTAAGRVFQDRASLVAALRGWSDEKRRLGALAPLDSQRIDEFSSREQMRKLSEFLAGVAR